MKDEFNLLRPVIDMLVGGAIACVGIAIAMVVI